jgi:hypothetical protein
VQVLLLLIQIIRPRAGCAAPWPPLESLVEISFSTTKKIAQGWTSTRSSVHLSWWTILRQGNTKIAIGAFRTMHRGPISTFKPGTVSTRAVSLHERNILQAVHLSNVWYYGLHLVISVSYHWGNLLRKTLSISGPRMQVFSELQTTWQRWELRKVEFVTSEIHWTRELPRILA